MHGIDVNLCCDCSIASALTILYECITVYMHLNMVQMQKGLRYKLYMLLCMYEWQ